MILNVRQEEHDHDEYTYQEQDDEEYEHQAEFDDLSGFRSGDSSTSNRFESAGRRRSSRAAATNGHRNSNGNGSLSEWRGERRSRRLGASSETQLDEPPPKRARTEDSVVSSNSADPPLAAQNGRNRSRAATVIKPTETAVEVVPGKKKSKFWVYAVEPVVAPQTHPPLEDYEMADAAAVGNSHQNGASSSNTDDASSPGLRTGGESYATSVRDSSSPSPSMDET